MRSELEAVGLHRSMLDPDPHAQFENWYAHAQRCGLYQAEAMSLATVDGTGRPSSRLVLLRGHDWRGFVFFTNYGSRKAAEMVENERVALLFGWQEISRQVRVEGRVERVDPTESDAYFATRPRASQIGAWASPQSSIVADRSELDARVAEQEARWVDLEDVERPAFWGGFRVVADRFEFWQGRANRLHDRFSYTPVAGAATWTIARLAP